MMNPAGPSTAFAILAIVSYNAFPAGRVAQRQSAPLIRVRSQVRILARPHARM